MTTMNEAGAHRSRLQIWILIGVFFAPLAIAFALYYGLDGWRPAGSTNHGILIAPARPLPQVALTSPDGAAIPQQWWREKWNVLYVGDGACDTRCRDALVLARQSRLALNDDMSRVRRVFLVSGNCCDTEYLKTQHPDLLIARADSPAARGLLDVLASASGNAAGHLYIVDPLGNVMMHYPPESPQRGLLEDLKKLLKLSHIG
jgi:hypothetical protein